MRPPSRRYFENLVYRNLFPNPVATDPRNFDEFVRQCLVREVRLENVRYYGSEEERNEELDALYPGHDYWSPASRNRLGQYPYHSWLFEIFDDLRLTRSDIDLLCTWEGTRSARVRYETERGIRIADLAWDGFPQPSRRAEPTVVHQTLPIRSRRETSEEPSDTPVTPIAQITPNPPATPNAPRRGHIQDYYGDANIWNFGTSAPSPIMNFVFPPVPNRPSQLQSYREWLNALYRSGTYDVTAAQTMTHPDWSTPPANPPSRYAPPARRDSRSRSGYTRHRRSNAVPGTTAFYLPPPPHTAGLQLYQPQTPADNNVAHLVADQQTQLQNALRSSLHDPMQFTVYHQIQDATAQALARTFGGRS